MSMGDGEGGVEEDVGGESKGKKCEPHRARLFCPPPVFHNHPLTSVSVMWGRPGVMGGSHPTYRPLIIPDRQTPVPLLWGFPTPL